MHNFYKTVYFIPVLLWTVLIGCLSTSSQLPTIPFNFLSPDKLGHLIFYALEALLWIWAFARAQSWKEEQLFSVYLSLLLAAAYGTLLEFVQATIPERTFDYADMWANFVGVVLAWVIYQKNKRFFVR